MSKDTINVNMNVYDIPILVEQLKKLETENKQLKEDQKKAIEYINNNSYSNLEFNVLNRETHIECHFNNEADPRDLLEILGGTDETN